MRFSRVSQVIKNVGFTLVEKPVKHFFVLLARGSVSLLFDVFLLFVVYSVLRHA